MPHKKHLSEHFRMVTPINSVINTVMLAVIGFFFMHFYDAQDKQTLDIVEIKQKLSWMEGHFHFKFDDSSLNPISKVCLWKIDKIDE